ncbi:TetR/AcrR family transcriptional regulator [Vibrio hangzhouensis]|uniref:Transcriptional regulator, TetR family n=1 Tax=Vibrio hangzhouensis TaxID=462991 RepID=A0A1H5VEH6_9VIBR|nr:TetR/AcrR family transcriptional regulator [Vibrio hangzhouensis]SEF85218.1 transcriptional regulator, TetR family [Vibrio hangzhouensis]
MIQKSEQKRLTILKAAGALFSERGYKVSMDEIAKRADVSKQTVYSHFRTKDQLFETCIQYRCEQRVIDESAFDLNVPVRNMLIEFGIRFQNMHLEPQVLQTYRNAVSQVSSHPQISAAYLKSGPEKTVAVVSEYLQHQHDQGQLHLVSSAKDAAMQLLLMFHGKAVYWAFLGSQIEQTADEQRAYIECCVDMFLTSAQCSE